MNIRIGFTILIVLCVLQLSAQTVRVTYYNSKYNEVPENKARYVKTVTNNTDGTTTTKEMDLRSGKETMNETYKGEEPYGIWGSQSESSGKGAQKRLDYNFDLIYDSSTSCVVGPDLISIKDYLKDDAEFGYKAPQVGSEKSFYHYIAMNLRYPAPAKEQGIQGRVLATFTVTEQGELRDIKIKKSVHIALDKEYARVLRGLKFDKPAMLNGKTVAVCVTAATGFRLE